MLWPVIVQPSGIVAIGALLRFYLSCSPPYNTVMLVHDSSRNPHTYTSINDLIDLLRTSLGPDSAPLSASLTIDIASALAVAQHSTLDDPRSLIVWLLDDTPHIADHFQVLHGSLGGGGGGAVLINARCDNIIIAPQQQEPSNVPPHELKRLLHYVAQRRIVNIALVMVATTDTNDSQLPLVLKLRYDLMTAVPYAATRFCAGHIFYDKTLDWRTDGFELLLFLDLNPPGVINLTRSIGVGDRTEFNVGGPFAYFASLLDAHLGTTSRMFAVKESDGYRNVQPQLARYLDEFEERAYREDDQQPRWLPYDLVEPQAYDDYTRNTTVLSFVPHTSEPAGTHSLYPFGTVNYVLCVPNDGHNRSTWWTALWRFPLIRIWALAIGVVTVARVALRWLQRRTLKQRPAVDMLFEICGVAFGGDVSTAAARLDNRAERVLLLFVSLFAMLAAILCSGLLFQKFTSRVLLPDIDSLEQLGEHSYLDVWIPAEFAEETEEWLGRRIPNRIVREDSDVIESMLYARNTSAAYILPETKVNILLNRIEMLDAFGNNLFHELQYTIVHTPIRFVVPEWFMVNRLSQLMQQAIEHGLMKYFATRTHNMLRSWRSGLQKKLSAGIDVMPMSELHFEIVIFGIGMLAGCVVFGLELVWKRRCWRLWLSVWRGRWL